MEKFIQVAAGVLLTVLLGIAVGKQNKEMALMITVIACCMVLAAAVSYWEPVLDLLDELRSTGQLDSEMVQILLKSVGISLIAEIASLICTDCGNAALGKGIQIMSVAVVLWLSMPLLRALMDLVQSMLGGV